MAARIIFNPTAGNGKARQLMTSIQGLLPHDVEVVTTQYPGHAVELAREVAENEEMTVISLGGDGTHHEVINGLMPTAKATFAVLPAGTGNDFVRMLGYPTVPAEMLQIALMGPTRRLDVGRVNDQYFLTVSGVGFDAEVAGWVNRHEKHGNGTWVFLRAILKHLAQYRSQPVTVTVDGASREHMTFLIAVGNSRYYAGGMLMCPEAGLDNGLFHVIWVRQLSRLAVLPLLARVFRGSHVKHPAVETFLAAELTVTGPQHLLVHADGEIIGHLPATFSIVPEAIRVRVGRPV